MADSGTSMSSSSSKDAMQQETFELSVDQDTPAQDSSTSLTSSSSKDARQRETFEQSVDQDTPAQDGGTSMKSSSSKDARQRETFKHSVGQDTPAQDGGTSMTSSSSKDARQRKTFKHSVDQETPAQDADASIQESNRWSIFRSWPFLNNSDRCGENRNMSLNLLGKSCYEVCIVPPQTSLKGGGACWFTFEPDLPSDITSGTAKFADLGFVDLTGVKYKTNSLVGAGIPPAEEEGWVTVKVRGKSDKTGKSSDLGETKLYYFDERKKALKQIVQDEEQYRSFFEAWNAACKGHLTDGSEKETKSSGSGRT